MNIKKRIIALFVCLVCGLSISQSVFAATPSNFSPSRVFSAATFSDVNTDDWFYENVKICYEIALVDGDGSAFHPAGNVTIAEALKLAANLRSVYETGKPLTQSGDAWYSVYLDYCIEEGIIAAEDYPVPTGRAARSDFVKILSSALPDEMTTPANEVLDGAIPDVSERYSYGAAVYEFYRAGILVGSGTDGEFYPNNPISRAELAAVISRIVRPEMRARIQKVSALTAEEIYAKCAPAVFHIEVFDKNGDPIKQGSGFFIESTGLAVTNCHVIGDALSATATTADGKVHKIVGMYGFDIGTDCALIKVEGSGFPVIPTADYLPATGADVFTIGNPIGLVNSFSRGIVSTSERFLENRRYIQIDAAISPGSSGGALIDAAGRVIGITSAGIIGGQGLNLAMPISVIDALPRTKALPLGTYSETEAFYEGLFPAPDFGAYANLKPLTESRFFGTYSATYNIGSRSHDELVEGYRALLEKYYFESATTGLAEHDESPTTYYNSLFDIVVDFKVANNQFSVTVY